MVAEYYSPPPSWWEISGFSPSSLGGRLSSSKKCDQDGEQNIHSPPHLGEENMKISKITQIFGACGAENLIFDPKLRHFWWKCWIFIKNDVLGAAGAENFHSPPHNGGENDNFCNQSWGGEYQVLKSATKMGGGEQLILPLTMGGPLSMVFGCYQNRKKPLFWGGDRPPIMGGERIFPPRSCILVNILPSMIFSW